jgi:hypothetical protein
LIVTHTYYIEATSGTHSVVGWLVSCVRNCFKVNEIGLMKNAVKLFKKLNEIMGVRGKYFENFPCANERN